ncbi:MAG: toxin-antitoxin system protein [Oscillospiraceae bacterium]|nr:toxin-antitoxin system protein [Oscillospiraceae bacterium]
MKPLKVKVSVTLDEDIVDKIKALSENDDRSFSQYVNHILKKHIEKEQKSEDNLHV